MKDKEVCVHVWILLMSLRCTPATVSLWDDSQTHKEGCLKKCTHVLAHTSSLHSDSESTVYVYFCVVCLHVFTLMYVTVHLRTV